ncbi:hypothetical protein J4H55_24115 [Vibrio alginolyticus]|uniref:hypothetical protein n=1 Tax=Vibrio alginolyticus TaxID=663 RepID=UPI001BD44E19|nr:hypothetical protein [Vibrio alginolyticus]MBS9995555.1 hypothetical protein [Vibrio alginolyticus]
MEALEWFKLIEMFLVTFIAAFVGVWAAYKIEREQRNKIEIQGRLKEFCNVQMQLRLQHTLLKTIKEYLSQHENDNERFKKVLPTEIPKNVSYLDLRNVKFLLINNNVLAYNIITVQQTVNMSLLNYDKRSKKHYEWQANPVNGRTPDENAQLRLCEKSLKEMTDINYSEIYEVTEHIEYFMQELSVYAKSEFKNIQEVDMYTEQFSVELEKRKKT